MFLILTLVCGDFNSIPTSAAYKLIKTGRVEPTDPDFGGHEYGTYSKVGLSHDLSFQSAYYYVNKEEPEYTNYTGDFVGSLDYIFYDEELLTTSRVLQPLEVSEVKRHNGALPNPWMCSDHIPMVAYLHEKLPVEN